MIEYHGDPQNYIILACYNRTILILNPSRNWIEASFDLEEAI